MTTVFHTPSDDDYDEWVMSDQSVTLTDKMYAQLGVAFDGYDQGLGAAADGYGR